MGYNFRAMSSRMGKRQIWARRQGCGSFFLIAEYITRQAQQDALENTDELAVLAEQVYSRYYK